MVLAPLLQNSCVFPAFGDFEAEDFDLEAGSDLDHCLLWIL